MLISRKFNLNTICMPLAPGPLHPNLDMLLRKLMETCNVTCYGGRKGLYLQLYKMTFIKTLFVILLDNVQWNQLCHWKNSVQ